MRKIVNEAGKEAIASFVRENLSGRVSDATVKSYIDMAESQMVIHGGLPCLEISMCFSMTGVTEYLELESDEVTYEDAVLDSIQSLQDFFGGDILSRLQESGITVTKDGYVFSVTPLKTGGADVFSVKCLGPEQEK